MPDPFTIHYSDARPPVTVEADWASFGAFMVSVWRWRDGRTRCELAYVARENTAVHNGPEPWHLFEADLLDEEVGTGHQD